MTHIVHIGQSYYCIVIRGKPHQTTKGSRKKINKHLFHSQTLRHLINRGYSLLGGESQIYFIEWVENAARVKILMLSTHEMKCIRYLTKKSKFLFLFYTFYRSHAKGGAENAKKYFFQTQIMLVPNNLSRSN